MKNLLLLIGFAFVFSVILFTVSYSAEPVLPGQIIAGQSYVTFSISHVSGKVTGKFTGMSGTVTFDENNPESSQMDVTLDASTIDTENRARDSDLRKEKFFDVGRYPQIRFRSKEVTRGAENFQVKGDLTIKDITREVIIPFNPEKKDGVTVFTGNFSVNRKDFNLGKSAFPPIGKVANVQITAVVDKPASAQK